ncbi:MAG: hypothetical protein ABIS20_07750 [Thermoanaerobaculia bacterium]
MDAELFEFAARLKTQGTVLCVPLGKSLGTALKQAGFHPDQEITIRFGHERLEILPRDTPEEIRGKLKLAAGELRAFRERMRGYAMKLPAVSDEDLEAEETLEGELLGMIECLVADDLDPAIHKLETVDELGPDPSALPEAPRGKRS